VPASSPAACSRPVRPPREREHSLVAAAHAAAPAHPPTLAAPDLRNDPFFRFFRGLPVPMPREQVPVETG